MADPKAWEDWTQDDYDRAASIVDSPPAGVAPEKLSALRENVLAWEAQERDNVDDAGATPSEPAPAEPEGELPQSLQYVPPAQPQQSAAPVSAPSGRGQADQGAAMLRWLGVTGGDLARGAGRGVTFDGMAPMSAAVTPEIERGKTTLAARAMGFEEPPIPREYAAGSATADLVASNRRDDAEAQARSPYATAAGRAVGLAPAAVASTAMGGPAGMVAAPVAMGLLERSGASDAPMRGDAKGYVRDVLDPASVATDATVGMGVPSAVRAVSGVPPAVSEAVRSFAHRNRGAASGATGAELAAKERVRPGYTEWLGRGIEREGLHMRPGVANVIPSTASVYGRNATALREQLDRDIGQALEDATAQGVTARTEDVIGRMVAVRNRIPVDTPEGASLRSQVDERIALVEQNYSDGTMTPRQLHSLKKQYEQQAGFKSDRNAPPSDRALAKQYRSLASAPRVELRNAMGEQAEQTATAPLFAQGVGRYPVASAVENYAINRSAREVGNQPVGLSGQATGSFLGMLASEVGRRGGRDVIADVGHGVARTLEGSSTGRAALDTGATTGVSPAMAAAWERWLGAPERTEAEQAAANDELQRNPELQQQMRRKAEREEE